MTQRRLKLPALDFASLDAANKITPFKMTTVAWQTTIDAVDLDGFGDYTYVFRFYGHIIGQISKDEAYLTNAGYDTSTTAARLNAIAVANKLNVYVGLTNRKTVLRDAARRDIATFEAMGDGVLFNRSPIAPAGWARRAVSGITVW